VSDDTLRALEREAAEDPSTLPRLLVELLRRRECLPGDAAREDKRGWDVDYEQVDAVLVFEDRGYDEGETTCAVMRMKDGRYAACSFTDSAGTCDWCGHESSAETTYHPDLLSCLAMGLTDAQRWAIHAALTGVSA
jgi:hypothetical protein